MTFQTYKEFFFVLYDEGFEPSIIKEIWDNRPTGIGPYEEDKLRATAKWMLADYPEYRRQGE